MSAAAHTFKCSQSFAESAGDKSRQLNTEKQTHETASRANKRPGLDLSPGEGVQSINAVIGIFPARLKRCARLGLHGRSPEVH